MTETLITCTGPCRQTLPRSSFYAHARDGYQQPCKDCHRKAGKSASDKAARARWKRTPAGKASCSRRAKAWYWKHKTRI